MRSVALAIAGFVAMEPVTALVHRFVMHGLGRRLHRSHHRVNSTGWEANDAFPVVFAGLTMLAFAIGFHTPAVAAVVPVAVGVTLYGAAYALVHDVYTHRRVRWFGTRRVRVLDALARRHRVHHERGGAPYGMLVPLRARSSGSRPFHEPLAP